MAAIFETRNNAIFDLSVAISQAEERRAAFMARSRASADHPRALLSLLLIEQARELMHRDTATVGELARARMILSLILMPYIHGE